MSKLLHIASCIFWPFLRPITRSRLFVVHVPHQRVLRICVLKCPLYQEHHARALRIHADWRELAIGFKLSEILTLYQTSQLFAFRSAWTYEKDQKQGDSLIDCAKVFCTEAAENVSSMALQILSGEGFLYGNVAEQAYRCSKFGQIAGRSTELSRVRIGDHALGVRP